MHIEYPTFTELIFKPLFVILLIQLFIKLSFCQKSICLLVFFNAQKFFESWQIYFIQEIHILKTGIELLGIFKINSLQIVNTDRND